MRRAAASPLRLVPVPLAAAALAVGLVQTAHATACKPEIAFESNRGAFGAYQVFVMNAGGACQTQLTSSRANFDPAWSPGGEQLVFERDSATGKYSDIWVMNPDGSDPRMLTNMGGPSRNPSWSPDGKTIAFQFSKNPAGPYAIYLADAKTAGPLTLGKGVTRAGPGSHPAWSSDGSKIAFDDDGQIYFMNVQKTAPRQQLTKRRSGVLNINPAWSPGDKMIAFTSNRTGSYQIWAMSLSPKGVVVRLRQLTGKSPGDGQNFDPSWSPDGKTIVFASNRGGNLQLYSMSSSGGNPKRLTNDSTVDLAPNFWQNSRPSSNR